jgi:predicted extracellular nuclease
MKRFLPFLFLSFLLAQCGAPKPAQPAEAANFRIGFYNVENLYDNLDDPNNGGDDEFLPTSKKQYTAERYQTKLEHLAKVVEGMGYPAILGLAEVENEKVLEDFTEKTSLRSQGYGIVHFESPDFRGIDVAFLYQKSQFQVLQADTVRIHFPAGMIPDIPNYTTRDLLVVEGRFKGKDLLHIIVAHLPSRSGGQRETEARRQYVASQIQQQVAAIFQKDPNASIIIMGDMNDEPTDPSIAQSLGAMPISGAVKDEILYNCFSALKAEGKGSYHYKENWNMLDQIILSGSLVKRNHPLKYSSSTIFQEDWMMYRDEKYGLSPSRTYGGDRYYGGYSDHLPVYITLEKTTNR